MIVIKVAAQFFKIYRPRKTLREPDHTKRMRHTVIYGAAIPDDSRFLDIPGGRNDPTIMPARQLGTEMTRNRKDLTQIIHSSIVSARTNSPIEGREISQDLHHSGHATLRAKTEVRSQESEWRPRQAIVLNQGRFS